MVTLCFLFNLFELIHYFQFRKIFQRISLIWISPTPLIADKYQVAVGFLFEKYNVKRQMLNAVLITSNYMIIATLWRRVVYVCHWIVNNVIKIAILRIKRAHNLWTHERSISQSVYCNYLLVYHHINSDCTNFRLLFKFSWLNNVHCFGFDSITIQMYCDVICLK